MTDAERDATPMLPDGIGTREVLGMRVDATSYEDATRRVVDWSRSSTGRYVCIANVHMTMESWDDPSFRRTVNGADLVTPDGVPLVWALRALGIPDATRVYGPTLMLRVCEEAALRGVKIGLYGGRPAVLRALEDRLVERFPKLDIAYAFSPPFRPLTAEEDDRVVGDIVTSGARILFVGLGCPKQELWMARHQDRLPLVQLGVGAGFDFHAGTVPQAPGWLQQAGLEWAFRWAMEPRRLTGRYLRHNPRFIWHFVRQLLGADPSTEG